MGNLDEFFESDPTTIDTTPEPQESASKKLERRRRIEEYAEIKRLREAGEGEELF